MTKHDMGELKTREEASLCLDMFGYVIPCN